MIFAVGFINSTTSLIQWLMQCLSHKILSFFLPQNQVRGVYLPLLNIGHVALVVTTWYHWSKAEKQVSSELLEPQNQRICQQALLKFLVLHSFTGFLPHVQKGKRCHSPQTWFIPSLFLCPHPQHQFLNSSFWSYVSSSSLVKISYNLDKCQCFLLISSHLPACQS